MLLSAILNKNFGEHYEKEMYQVKKKILSLALVLALTISLAPAALAADLVTAPAPAAPMAHINTERSGGGMGTAKGICDYPEYFDEEGVLGVVADGGFYINGFQVPATAEELGEDGFVVNCGTSTLTAKDGKFFVDGKDKGADYATAVKALINDGLPGGLHIDLYDIDGDNKADKVTLWYTEGVIVNEISKDADGNYILYRGNLTNVPANAGRLYDDERFNGTSGEVIKPENFDTTIEAGDACIFYYTPDGWIVERATEINGIFEGGEDHGYYQIDGVQYPDTMKYSRDNLIVAQRNGEYTNAHKFFGFINNDDGLKTSLWLDPKSGSPIGLSANENARTFLYSAISQAKAYLRRVELTADATAEQIFAYNALVGAVEGAEATLSNPASYNSEYDFYTYYLYLALAGTGGDIGAAFAGFFANPEFGWERMNAFPGFLSLFGLTDTILLQQAGDFNPAVDTNDGIYLADLTDKYFEGGVEAGLEALLEAGQVYLNGQQIPADAETFYLNNFHAIWEKEPGVWTWQAHDKLNSDNPKKIDHKGDYSYEFARRRFVLAVSALRGMDTIIWAAEGSEYATRVDFFVQSGGQIEKIQVNDDGTTTVWGVPVDATSYNTDGGPNDVESVTLPTANFDPTIEEGDTILYWYDADGCHMERCIPFQGPIAATADHFTMETYGVNHSDALIVRFNMQAGSRPMQFLTAAKNLELSDIPVTLWNTSTGHTVGLSRMEYAKEALERGIAYCEGKLAGTKIVVSDDGVGVPVGAYWAPQADVDAYYAAIENAKAVLANPDSTNAQMDAATQVLGAEWAGNERGQGGLKLKSEGDLIAQIDTQRVGGGGMGKAVGIYDYPQYFDETGVMGVVEAGNFYINDFAVPANPEALAALGADGFVVNSGAIDLKAANGQFKVGKDAYDNYADAIYALVHDELPGGLHIDLYDTDADGKAEVVKLWYTEGLVVNEISKDADGNYILYRGDLKRVPTYAGRLYDADNFGGILGETIKPENFDTEIEVGDGCIFYLTPDGWIVEAAHEANGILVEGIDHDYYQIDDTKYVDTMKYSRDNLIVANRNGEITNAHTYFGFKNNDDGLKVSMWMDTKSWSPIGITSNDNAKVFLADAIAQAKAKLAAVNPTKAVTDDQKLAYAALEEAIKLAEETLADETSYNSELDFYVYYLYLTLNGTGSDIGAAFAGFYGVNGWGFKNAYPGFDTLFASTDVEYTVVAGDNLWNIAKAFYGNGAAYTKIVEANGIKDANLIYAGQKLVIPG